MVGIGSSNGLVRNTDDSRTGRGSKGSGGKHYSRRGFRYGIQTKQNRNLKVYEQSGYHYNPTPTITLKGKWLEELSFPAGTPIIVKCENGVLTIIRSDEYETKD